MLVGRRADVKPQTRLWTRTGGFGSFGYARRSGRRRARGLLFTQETQEPEMKRAA